MGLLMNSMVVGMYVFELFGPLLCIYTDVDPALVLINDITTMDQTNWLKLSLRILTLLFNVLEACRTLALYNLMVLSMFTILLSKIKIVCGMIPNDIAFTRYSELQYIYHIGYAATKKCAGLSMLTAFIVEISALSIVFAGYGKLPLYLYGAMCLFAMVTLYVSSVIIPIAVECNESTTDILKVLWVRRGMVYWKEKLKTNDFARKILFKIWRKGLRAKMPITIYYGNSKFDQETKTNFYINILDNTINLILLL